MTDDLQAWIGRRIVLDTAGPILYLGTLEKVSPAGVWLTEADVHDCRDGHASKEVYLIEAGRHGVTPNRRRVFVLAGSVFSVSALEDIVIDPLQALDAEVQS